MNPTLAHALAAFLAKAAKHLALLACIAIVGIEHGKTPIGQSAIIFVVAMAALLHSVGRTLQRRLSGKTPRYRAPP